MSAWLTTTGNRRTSAVCLLFTFAMCHRNDNNHNIDNFIMCCLSRLSAASLCCLYANKCHILRQPVFSSSLSFTNIFLLLPDIHLMKYIYMYNSRMPCFAMHVKCWHTGSVRSRSDIPWLEYRILIKYCAYVFSVVSKIVNFCTSSRIIRPALWYS